MYRIFKDEILKKSPELSNSLETYVPCQDDDDI